MFASPFPDRFPLLKLLESAGNRVELASERVAEGLGSGQLLPTLLLLTRDLLLRGLPSLVLVAASSSSGG